MDGKRLRNRTGQRQISVRYHSLTCNTAEMCIRDSFTTDLCQTLDHMIAGNEAPQRPEDSETQLARIRHRLARLYPLSYTHLDVYKRQRLGSIDVVVGINLLREGLDLPEVSLVAILDADKEGFLRDVYKRQHQ